MKSRTKAGEVTEFSNLVKPCSLDIPI